MWGAAAAVLWTVFWITLVIRWMAGDGGLMGREMLAAAPPETTGLRAEEYAGVGQMTAEFLTGGREAFQYVALVGSENSCARAEVFQPHEAAHMADVRELITLDGKVCLICGLGALAVTAAGCARRSRRRDFLRGIRWGLGLLAAVLGGMLIWALADFDGLFVTFHRVAFRNDGWLLDPRTDLLIRLMPIQFFIRLGIRGGLRALAAPAALLAVSVICEKRLVNGKRYGKLSGDVPPEGGGAQESGESPDPGAGNQL